MLTLTRNASTEENQYALRKLTDRIDALFGHASSDLWYFDKSRAMWMPALRTNPVSTIIPQPSSTSTVAIYLAIVCPSMESPLLLLKYGEKVGFAACLNNPENDSALFVERKPVCEMPKDWSDRIAFVKNTC